MKFIYCKRSFVYNKIGIDIIYYKVFRPNRRVVYMLFDNTANDRKLENFSEGLMNGKIRKPDLIKCSRKEYYQALRRANIKWIN